MHDSLKRPLLLAALILAWPKPAWAYVDPGSAAIFLQVVFATLVGGAVVFRSSVREAFRFLRRKLFGDPDRR